VSQRRRKTSRMVPLPFTPYAVVDLSKGHVALIDADDIPTVDIGAWSVDLAPKGRKYASRHNSAGKVYMHRVIMAPQPGQDVDHVDGCTLLGAPWVLDNRRANMRLASRSQNNANARLRTDNSTGYRGVWRSPSGTYTVEVAMHGTRRRVGRFATAQAAAEERDRIAAELHGEFARLNLARSA